MIPLLSNLLRRRRVEAELDAELRAYVDQLTDEKIAAGVSPEEARRAALLELGGMEQVKEEVRAVRAGAWLDAAAQDLRYAARALRRNPGFSTVVVITLALGIGVNTAIFSVVNALLYKPLPGVAEPERIAWLRASQSYPAFVALAGEQRRFTALAAMGGTTRMSLAADGRAERVTGELVTSGYFAVLGAEPQLGRGFVPEDERRNAPPVAVISDALWRRRFGADPGVVGRSATLNGVAVTIAGVAARGFGGSELGLPRELWVPLSLHERLTAPAGELLPVEGDRLARRDVEWLAVFGRLGPGVDLEEAQAETTALAARDARVHGDPDPERHARGATLLPLIGGLDPRDRLDARIIALFPMAIVGLVLLVACANVAGLLLARAVSRGKELAVRRALGASRGRLVRQLFTESLLLAVIAGAAALLVAHWTGLAILDLARAAPISPPDLGLDARVLVFTLALSLLTAAVAGLAPALRGSRADVMGALRSEMIAAGPTASRLRRALVVAQVALSFLLLVGAGLFARALGDRAAAAPGFAVDGALLIDVDPGIVRAPEARGRELYRRVLAEVAALPGVDAVTLLRIVPLSLSSAETTVESGARTLRAGFNVVGPDHLRAMGIPLVRGRDLGPRDDQTAPEVVVINETLARELFPGEDAVGRRLRFGASGPWQEVIGVAADTKTGTLGEAPHPFLYRPLFQEYQGAMTLVVRARGDARRLAGPVEDVLRRLEPDLPLDAARTLSEQLDFALLPARLGRALLGAFGLLGLALAAIGLYGLVAYAVRRRTHEIGVRMALGATRRDVVGLVARENVVVAAVGLAIGVALALASTRLLAAVLAGVSPTDPWTFGGATLLLVVVAALASWLPARRAARVDPMTSLRHE